MGKTLGVNGPLSPSPQVACLYLSYRMARSLLWPFASYSLNPHSAAVCTGEVTRPAFVGLTSHLWIQNRQITQRPRVLGAVGEQVTRSRVGREACLPSAEGTSPAKRRAGPAGHGGAGTDPDSEGTPLEAQELGTMPSHALGRDDRDTGCRGSVVLRAQEA